MQKRIITAIVALCVLIPVLIFSGTVVFPIAIALVSVIALFEMYRCIGREKEIHLTLPAYIYSLTSPFVLRFVEDRSIYVGISFVCAVAYIVYLFFFAVKSKGKETFMRTGEIFVLGVYIIAAFNSIIYIRDFDASGKYLYLLIFVGAWVTDTFAYFVGVLFGKHKLIPEVSPKKTVEGSIGGILFTSLAFLLFGVIVKGYFDMNSKLLLLAVSGAVISVVSQIGDLVMSVIKREHGVKDYGNIFPGHGGVLDRFDSILVVSLVLSAICVLAKNFNIALL